MIELWQTKKAESPAEIFSGLSRECEALGIDKQDMYGDFGMNADSSWLRKLENELKVDLNKEDCLFLPSGTMAQQIALMIYKERSGRNTFTCHFSSHLLLHEQDSYSKLCNMEACVIPADPSAKIQLPVSYESALPFLSSPAPACMILECPHREIGGKCTPYEDIVKLSEYCRYHGIAFHMDGARLFEASAAYNKPLGEFCALFDSVYISFYKGLGGMTGAALLGEASFIAEARVWLRRFGGNLFTLMPYAVSGWLCYRQNAGSFSDRRCRLQHVVELVSEALSAHHTPGSSSMLIRFDPPVPEVSLVHVYFNASVAVVNAAREAAAEECGVRCFSKLREGQFGANDESYTEFNLGPLNGNEADETWILGWTTFAEKLKSTLMSTAA